MKAIVCRRYGPPESLTVEEIETPTAGDDELLIRVRAASVNPIDKVVRGRPLIIRAVTGLAKPKYIGVGHDLAGEVVAVGKNVTRFKPGDEVFGAGRGSLAEVARAAEGRVARKPANVTFEEAAAVPIAGITALQALRDKAGVQAGQEVLINGAGGGVGSFAVQIAKSFGARVTAVCSSRNVETVKALGADRVIDYAKEDFTRAGANYDVVVDCVGNHSLKACCRAIRPKGMYLAVGTPTLRHLLAVKLASPFVSQKVVLMMAAMRAADLEILAHLLESKTVVPLIGQRFPLRGAGEALRQIEAGHTRGKLVIAIDA